MMDSLCSAAAALPSDASMPGRRNTPPYTPARRSKRRLERSATPASRAGSTHPTETISPARKIVKRSSIDNIKVEELVEGDVGYVTDVDVVYPDELEENSTDSNSEDTMSDASDVEAAGLTRRLSRLRCGDDREVEFEQLRQRLHLDRRAGPRPYKRSHSQSVSHEVAPPDPEGMDDHDVAASRRRLRRRTRGPSDVSTENPGILAVSLASGSGYVTATEGEFELPEAEPEAMDVDDEDEGS